MNVMRSLLQFVEPFRWRVVLAVSLGFLAIAANIGLMGSSGYLIASAALRPETVLLLWVPIVAVRFFGLSRAVFRYLERLASHDLTFRVLSRIRVWFYGQIEPQAIKLLETKRSADVLGSAVSDIEQIQNLYLRVLAPPMIAVSIACLGFVFFAWYDVVLALILTGMMFITGLGMPWLNHRLGRSSGEEDVRTRATLYTQSEELISGMQDLIAYGRDQERIDRFDQTQAKLDAIRGRQNVVFGSSSGLMLGMANITMWLILGYAVIAVSQGRLEAVAIPTLVLVALACFEAIAPLPAAFQQMGQTIAAGQRLLQTAGTGTPLELPAEGEERYPEDSLTSECLSLPTLVVEGLQFGYGKRALVLHDIRFALTPGKHLAIVGESGAGKSTLVHVLLGLRPYDNGKIWIEGKETKNLPESFVREHYAVVSQNPYLFHATILDNLRMAKPDATLQEIHAALQAAQLTSTIDNMADGIHTVIGEKGARLSGGERQRLALARALLRPNSILIFDEPTAGLDSLTEQAFMHMLATELAQRSIIWITHRIHGLENMDEILTLVQGKVVERGTHHELLHRQGQYYRLWKHQAEPWV
jgi:thiol reductant ABC exporter CydC subunit